MPEYISRCVLIDMLTKEYLDECKAQTIKECMYIIDGIPDDDTKVQHGHWVKGRYGEVACSLCMVGIQRKGEGGKEEWVDLSDASFCPSCGARMDGWDEDAE